jgi:oxygen-independent coproporphyrinogen III oxidase
MRGLYLHIPFCEKKCIYCDFYSLETTHLISRFVETLLLEIDLRMRLLPATERHFDTVFFGGGTPSLLSVEQMSQILAALHQHATFASNAEWTMECNPGTITTASLRGYRSLGINRLSFGVQSFFEADLHFLSRIHSRNDAVNAVQHAREAGFENVNLDLMFALPGQSFEYWQANVEMALRLQTEHISAYSLIFEEGTPLHAMRLRGEVREQNEDADAAMYEWTMKILAAHGYQQYEVSNFAKPGKECRHNCIYWQGDEYVSVGPSAHGYIADERYWNVRSLKRYTDAVHRGELPVVNSEQLSTQEKMFERAFLELRSKGLRIAEFLRDFDIHLPTLLQPLFKKYEGLHLWHTSETVIALTPKGYVLCDAITADVITLLEKHSGNEWRQSHHAQKYALAAEEQE